MPRGRIGCRGAILVMGLAVVALGCGSPEERSATHLDGAERYREAGQMREAVLELRNALASDPGNAEAAFRLGQLLESLGKNADASFFYAEAARIDPDRTDAVLAQASVLLASRPARSRELIDAVLAHEPRSVRAHVLRSRLALMRRDLETALASADQALALAGRTGDGAAALQVAIVRRAQLVQSLRSGQDFDAAGAEAAWRALDESAASGAEAWRVAFERANLLASWPGREVEAELPYRRAAEQARAEAPPASRQQVFLQTLQYARANHGRDLERWVLETWLDGNPEDLFPWQELARLEEQEGGDPDRVYQRLLQLRPQDASAHHLFVRHLVGRGRVDEAIAHLGAAADRVERGRPVLLGERVRLQVGTGDLDGAHATVETLVSDSPHDVETAVARARLARGNGRLDEAARTLRGHPDLPRHGSAQRLLGEIELARGHADLALGALDQALRLSGGKEAVLWLLKGRAHFQLGEWRAVVRSYRVLGARERRLPPEDRLRLARAYYALGQTARGREVLEALLALPEAPRGAALEFARHEGERDSAAARRALEAALARTPASPRHLAALARLDLREGAPERALAHLDAAFADAREMSPLLRRVRAQVLLVTGRREPAREELRRVLETEPDQLAAIRLLAELEVREKGRDAVLAALEARGAARSPTEGVLLAQLLGEGGDWVGAQRVLESVLERHGDRELPGAWSALAEILAQEGNDPERAVRLARRAATRRPGDPEVLDHVGVVYLRRELPDLSLEAFRRAADLSALAGAPDPRLELHRGLALEALHRRDEARRAFERALALEPGLPAARAALNRLRVEPPPGPEAPS